MRRLLPALALLLLAVAPPAEARTIDKHPDLWATVNICDSRQSPDTLGVRASMPGSGRRRERMLMRFRAQFFSKVDRKWHNFLADGLDSGWVRVGSARRRAPRQAGWNFPFALEPGDRYRVRAAVRFQWRKRGRVVRSAAKLTRGGHRTAFSEPKGYSAATCVLKG